MDIEDKLNQHEHSIGRIEGTLQSLATKEFVRKEVNEAVKAIDAKIDAQTKDIRDQIEELSNNIAKECGWRMKLLAAPAFSRWYWLGYPAWYRHFASLGVISA